MLIIIVNVGGAAHLALARLVVEDTKAAGLRRRENVTVEAGLELGIVSVSVCESVGVGVGVSVGVSESVGVARACRRRA